MNLSGAVALVTGGGSGIGAALATRFVEDGAEVVIADVDISAAQAVADRLGDAGHAVACDVTDAAQNVAALDAAEVRFGPVDLLCANAGIVTGMGVEADSDVWQRAFAVNVMGIANAASAYLPRVRRRGHGHLLVTASAAGLLTSLGDAPYAATKHAAVGLAEWLAITHATDGLGVSCLCPQGVRTPMLTGDPDAVTAKAVAALGVIEPEECADAVVAGLAEESFLILPHPEVADYMRAKCEDHERWLAAMRRVQHRLTT